MANLAAQVQVGEQGQEASAPRRTKVSVSIQTQTTDELEQMQPQAPAGNGAHGQDSHVAEPTGTAQSSGVPQSAVREFIVHPPAPPQEGGTAQQPGEAQELVQVQTSARMPAVSNIPTGSALTPVQGTLVIPPAANPQQSEQQSVRPVPAAVAAHVVPAKHRAPARKPLNVSQKLAIINLHKGKERVGTADLALRYGVPERTIKQVCAPQNEEKFLKALKRPEKLSPEDRAALRRRMISKACTGKSRLTVAQKLEIIKLHQTSAGKTGVPAAQLAEQFNVAERTIRKICCEKQRERLERFSQSEASIDATRLCREDLYPELTKELLKWIEGQVRHPSLERPLTQSVILHRALQIGAELGLAHFKGSKGWMHRWMKRYNIRAIIDGSAMLPSAARALKESQEAAGEASGGAADGAERMSLVGMGALGNALLGGGLVRTGPVLEATVDLGAAAAGLAVVQADSVMVGAGVGSSAQAGATQGEGFQVVVPKASRPGGKTGESGGGGQGNGMQIDGERTEVMEEDGGGSGEMPGIPERVTCIAGWSTE